MHLTMFSPQKNHDIPRPLRKTPCKNDIASSFYRSKKIHRRFKDSISINNEKTQFHETFKVLYAGSMEPLNSSVS
jgi:hypothetical protein